MVENCDAYKHWSLGKNPPAKTVQKMFQVFDVPGTETVGFIKNNILTLYYKWGPYNIVMYSSSLIVIIKEKEGTR